MPSRIPPRGYIVFAHDIVMAAASFELALYLRLGDGFFTYASYELKVLGALAFAAIAALVFWLMGLYRGVWRYASMNDLMAITRSGTLVILIFVVVMFAWTRLHELPRSLPFINWFVLMALLGGPRFLYRLFKDRRFDFHLEANGLKRIPVLLAGAGDGAETFIRSLARDAGANYRVVGIVSESDGRVGRHIHGVEVLGTTDDLARVVGILKGRDEAPGRLILTRDDMDGPLVRALLSRAGALGMTLARLPKLTDFKAGVADRVTVQPVAVEDLLGRPQTPLDRTAMRALIAGKRVLVTGAGGSIGSELVRQISAFGPQHLTLLDNSEHNLYTIDGETASAHPELARQALIADVRDRLRMGRIMAEGRPQLVFHAAALKHVPMVEANVIEGTLTNTVGTVNVADACRKAGVAVMVLISTDKAVNPTSIMGATKRLAERYCQSLDLGRDGGTRFVTVRFGNVLGSTGSVVPLFQRQLAAGGPLTVTHPEMSRYFMTVHEAVEVVLQASAIGSQGSQPEGKIFVLDMGEPVLILDLAHQIIRLAGLTPEKDIAIEFIGLRPGEKLYEEMFHPGEPLLATECPGLLLASPRAADAADLAREIDAMAVACTDADAARVMAVIRRLVPEYQGAGDPAPKRATA